MEAIILELLQGKGALKQKKLWKKVCNKLNIVESNEDATNEDGNENHTSSATIKQKKKEFKQSLAQLFEEKDIIEVDGEISINKAKKAIPLTNTKRKASLDDYKAFDHHDQEEEESARKRPKPNEDKKYQYTELWKNGEKHWKEGTFDPEYLRNNPDGITRLFCGNLNKKITEDDLHGCLPGITYIKWITDKQTGEFYGSSFIEMKDPVSAAEAVLKDGSKFMGRPLKIYYCPPRPGDKWPPREPSSKSEPTINQSKQQPVANAEGKNKNNNKNNNSFSADFAKTPKPEGCRKLFAGNLSYEIDDDTMCDFFKDCGTVIGLRWLTHKDSGDFKGCGYIEFSSTEEADKAILLHGKELLGRKIRLDWST